MTAFDDLTWREAMRQGHEALMESESLYADINASEGRSNLDIEWHLRRAEAKATQRIGMARLGVWIDEAATVTWLRSSVRAREPSKCPGWSMTIQPEAMVERHPGVAGS